VGRKALSEQLGFREALIVQADYGSAPGMGGLCELAVRHTKSKTEIWEWNDESGSALAVSLEPNAGFSISRISTPDDLPAPVPPAVNTTTGILPFGVGSARRLA